jgi:carboxylesterase
VNPASEGVTMNYAKYCQPFTYRGSEDIGILVIHGFTSTTSSMKYIADKLAEAGFHIELPCLPGHGTRWQDMNHITYKDWLTHLESNLAKLKSRVEKIFILGLSLGGGLALRLAQLHPEITGIILINHACKFTHPKFWFVPFIRLFIKSSPAIASDIKDPAIKEIGYHRTPTEGAYQMLQLLNEVRKELPRIYQPVLMFKSKEDHVIPARSTTYTYERISSQEKEIIWLDNSYHVATLDYDKDLIIKKSLEFIHGLDK